MRLLVQFVSLLALSSGLCMSVGPAVCKRLCVGSIKVFAGLTIGNTSPVWLLVGSEGTELQQSPLCWATGFGKPNQQLRIELAESKYLRVRNVRLYELNCSP